MLETISALAALVAAAFAASLTLRAHYRSKDSHPDLILAVADEYSRRLNKLEGRLVDLQVRLDILESLLEQIKQAREGNVATRKTPEEMTSLAPQSDITKHHDTLGNLELKILKCISEGAKTPSEVKAVVGRSREHVSRALKDLYESGFLNRKGGRPFVYSLSEKGRSALTGADLNI